jgi:hypothetical protein
MPFSRISSRARQRATADAPGEVRVSGRIDVRASAVRRGQALAHPAGRGWTWHVRGHIGSLAAASLVLASATSAAAGDALRAGLYEVVTQIAMPNVETGLRHATRSERRCLGEGDLATLFPVLDEPGLRHCRLDAAGVEVGEHHFAVRCEGDLVTSGVARWQLGPGRALGVLELRLGGKNMTLSEHVTATHIGDCD